MTRGNVERQGDQAIEHEDSKVLLVERNLTDTLQGITIDVEDTPVRHFNLPGVRNA